MRFLAFAVAGLCGLAPLVTHAETGEAMRMRGEQLAKDGRYTEAIDAFKAAERIEPRARHACLIALAYTRRELWPQAEIFLELCERRATPADPLPEWVPVAKQQLAERLATANVAAVTITVEPAGTPVALAVSSFAPDELFAPRTIHLPPGRHVIVATANGYPPAQVAVFVGDRTPQQIVIPLQPPATGTVDHTLQPVPALRRGSSITAKIPLVVIGMGGALVVGGAMLHILAVRPARNRLLAANELLAAGDPAGEARWSEAERDFDASRFVTGFLYGSGALTIGLGVALKYTVFKDREAPARVSVVPLAGGGMVSVGWTQ